MQSLQHKLKAKCDELDRVMVVLEGLRGGADNDAAAILAALRLGDSIERITAAMPPQTSSSFGDDHDGSSVQSLGSTYTASAHSWPTSPAVSQPGFEPWGLTPSTSDTALAAHFGRDTARDSLSLQAAARARAQMQAHVDPIAVDPPTISTTGFDGSFARRYSQPQFQFHGLPGTAHDNADSHMRDTFAYPGSTSRP
ncbi:hypothetical protein LTR53_009857 [Teratosphaeriaceae sp. CCFEE 6253]|nr:hypothetical protein LTR53_009857 [Teratosphaeriaceae sp. CCFEE 6253]